MRIYLIDNGNMHQGRRKTNNRARASTDIRLEEVGPDVMNDRTKQPIFLSI